MMTLTTPTGITLTYSVDERIERADSRLVARSCQLASQLAAELNAWGIVCHAAGKCIKLCAKPTTRRDHPVVLMGPRC